jgi:hypothetical protein
MLANYPDDIQDPVTADDSRLKKLADSLETQENAYPYVREGSAEGGTWHRNQRRRTASLATPQRRKELKAFGCGSARGTCKSACILFPPETIPSLTSPGVVCIIKQYAAFHL